MDTEQNSKGNASLTEARRHESGSRWIDSSRAYLNALVASDTLREVALAGLKRCATQARRAQRRETTQHDVMNLNSPEVFLAIGYTLSDSWSDALRLCVHPDETPSLLSESMRRRWSALNERIQFFWDREAEGLTENSEIEAVKWIALLRLLDSITKQGHISEAMMMCNHVLDHLQDPRHRALVLFETGRIGVLGSLFTGGILYLEESLSLQPSLKPEVDRLVDEILLHQPLYGEVLRDLLRVRGRDLKPDDLCLWVTELCENTAHHGGAWSITLGDALLTLGLVHSGQMSNFELSMSTGAYQAFAIALEIDDLDIAQRRHAFENLTLLSLTRISAPPLELEEDEPTLDGDSRPKVLSADGETEKRAIELIEGGESRLLLQLKEHQRFDLIQVFYQQKAVATFLTREERARAYSALAQIALSASNDLESAVSYIQQGAQLAPEELKLTPLLREARQRAHWPSLKTLLQVQLLLTHNSGKRQTLFRALSQGFRREGLWLDAYDALIACGEEGLAYSDFSADETGGDDSSSYSPQTEREIASLLRVKGAALSIGYSLIKEQKWTELIRLVERLAVRGAVAAELLAQGVKESPTPYPFIQLLLQLYEAAEQWEEWGKLIAEYPALVAGSPEERGVLITRALSTTQDPNSKTRVQLLRARAEWLGEVNATSIRQLKAWREYLVEQPTDLDALERLEERADALDAWQMLAEGYEAALTLRKMGKSIILERLCEIYEHRLQRRDDAARCWRQLLEISPQNEAAGAWLTLYFAEQQEWYQLLLICALWTPEVQHPVWVESKVRGHLGLRELEEAHFWWTQLTHARIKRLFIDRIIDLALHQKNGPLVLELIDEAVALKRDFQELGSVNPHASHSVNSMYDSTQYLQGVTLEVPSPSEQAGDQKPSYTREQYERFRARALYEWRGSFDALRAAEAWEGRLRQHPNDDEALVALIDLYAQLGKRRALIEVLSFIERDAGQVQRLRRSVIDAALRLESRFGEYTEAFKCWLALYEHSSIDRERCMAAFTRLSDRDIELVKLVQELHKLRADHTPWVTLKREHWLTCAQLNSDHLNQWGRSFSMARRALLLQPGKEAARAALIQSALPLNKWEAALDVLEEEGSWRALREAAHIAETRLGDRERACKLYQTSLEQLVSMKLSPYLHGLRDEIEAMIDRLNDERKGNTAIEEVLLPFEVEAGDLEAGDLEEGDLEEVIFEEETTSGEVVSKELATEKEVIKDSLEGETASGEAATEELSHVPLSQA